MKPLKEILEEIDEEELNYKIHRFKKLVKLGEIPKKDISKEYDKLKEKKEF